jgi:hypothetical protein
MSWSTLKSSLIWANNILTQPNFLWVSNKIKKIYGFFSSSPSFSYPSWNFVFDPRNKLKSIFWTKKNKKSLDSKILKKKSQKVCAKAGAHTNPNYLHPNHRSLEWLWHNTDQPHTLYNYINWNLIFHFSFFNYSLIMCFIQNIFPRVKKMLAF